MGRHSIRRYLDAINTPHRHATISETRAVRETAPPQALKAKDRKREYEQKVLIANELEAVLPSSAPTSAPTQRARWRRPASARWRRRAASARFQRLAGCGRRGAEWEARGRAADDGRDIFSARPPASRLALPRRRQPAGEMSGRSGRASRTHGGEAMLDRREPVRRGRDARTRHARLTRSSRRRRTCHNCKVRERRACSLKKGARVVRRAARSVLRVLSCLLILFGGAVFLFQPRAELTHDQRVSHHPLNPASIRPVHRTVHGSGCSIVPFSWSPAAPSSGSVPRCARDERVLATSHAGERHSLYAPARSRTIPHLRRGRAAHASGTARGVVCVPGAIGGFFGRRRGCMPRGAVASSSDAVGDSSMPAAARSRATSSSLLCRSARRSWSMRRFERGWVRARGSPPPRPLALAAAAAAASATAASRAAAVARAPALMFASLGRALRRAAVAK